MSVSIYSPTLHLLSAVLNIPRHFFHSSGLPKRPLISLESIIESVNRIKSHFEVPSIMRRALRIRPMCWGDQKWRPTWRLNKTCESFARRVSRIYRPTSNRADYRIIINWNVTSGRRVICIYTFIYFAIIWLHLILTLSLPRTLVHCQSLIGMQTAINIIIGKVARICAMFLFGTMQNESKSQGPTKRSFPLVYICGSEFQAIKR